MRSSRKPELALLLLLNVFAGWLLTAELWDGATLAGENLHQFSFFRDQWYSLNRFGEVAWWFPQQSLGWPGYLQSILGGVSALTPPFVLIGFVAWCLGRVGVLIQSFHHLYVFYFAFLVPLLVSLAAWSLVRQLTRSRAVIAFVLILTALSPGVIANAGDLGALEPLAYGLFFASAYLRFLRQPSQATFLPWGVSALLLALGLNAGFAAWNAVFVPLVLLLLPRALGGRAVVAAAFRALPREYGFALAGALLVCALPAGLALGQSGGVAWNFLQGRSYVLAEARPGNLFELLAAGLPGFGFRWDPQAPIHALGWALVPSSEGNPAAFTYYLGLLAWPLIGVGLRRGRSPMRKWVAAALGGLAFAQALAWICPAFAALLALFPPLRADRHLNDGLLASGGYVVLVFAAGYGLQTLLEGGAPAVRTVRWLHGVCLAAVLGIYLSQFGAGVWSVGSFGVLILIGLLQAIALSWLEEPSGEPGGARTAKAALLALVLLDLATHASYQARRTYHGLAVEGDSSSTLRLNGPGNIWADSLVTPRPLYELRKRGLKEEVLSPGKLFSSAHVAVSLDDELRRLAKPNLEGYESLALPEEARNAPAFAGFFSASPDAASAAKSPGSLSVGWSSYNQLQVGAEAAKASLLYVRDAYSPYWNATVNGQPAPVTPALFAFRAVAVPAGRSQVSFDFSPPGLGKAIGLAYLILLAGGLLCVRASRRAPGAAPPAGPRDRRPA